MRKLATLFARLHGALYRLLRGRLPGSRHMLILTTTGRKSGKRRPTPLLYVNDGNDWIVVASNGGRDSPPAWWLNLQAKPEATMEIRGTLQRVSTEPVDATDRSRLWGKLVAIFHRYEKYAQSTDRTIPLVRLKAV